MGEAEKRGEILMLGDKIVEILNEDECVHLRYDETIPMLLANLRDALSISKALKLKHFVEIVHTLV